MFGGAQGVKAPFGHSQLLVDGCIAHNPQAVELVDVPRTLRSCHHCKSTWVFQKGLGFKGVLPT